MALHENLVYRPWLVGLTFVIFVLLTTACRKIPVSCVLTNGRDCFFELSQQDCYNQTTVASDKYDIFLIMGQSNTCSGKGLDPNLDGPHPRIMQLGRHDNQDLKIIPAREPLDHHYRVPESIGFAMAFARAYVCDLLAPDRNVLLIPAALNDTGFKDQRWRVGDPLYQDALFRVNNTLRYHPNSIVKGILWHQGEKDVGNSQYTAQLDSMIVTFRRQINQPDAEELPWILGGMVPYWVDRSRERQQQECLIKATPARIDFTAFADPRNPCTIRKIDTGADKIHYDAAGQRQLGQRYYDAYLQLR